MRCAIVIRFRPRNICVRVCSCVHFVKMTTLQESLKEQELKLEAMTRQNTQLQRRL